MAAPVTIRKPPRKIWTVADLYRRFGPIAFERIRQDPPPGCGTVEDVDRLNNHEDRLYELVDGILVEKTVGFEESVHRHDNRQLTSAFSSSRVVWGSWRARGARSSSISTWCGSPT